jgi:hypothetical protein
MAKPEDPKPEQVELVYGNKIQSQNKLKSVSPIWILLKLSAGIKD